MQNKKWQRRQPREQILCSRRKRWKQRNISYCTVITITTLEWHISPNYNKLNQILWHYQNAEKWSHILGENSKMITTAARYVSACRKLRLSASGQNWSKIISCMLYKGFFFVRNVLNIFLVCGKKRQNACTYLLNYFADLFLFYVFYNRLLHIHVMENALVILCMSCQ